MENLIKLTGAAVGGLFLASCVTYPYQTAFTSCEQEANSCYRVCEDIPDESGYVACQSHCDRSIDRCFDQAYTPYRSGYGYGYTSYGYSSPWYGRYGSWYPDTGYYLSFNYYDRYGYRKKRHHPPRQYEYKNDRNHPPRTSAPPRVYDNDKPSRPYTGPRRRPDNLNEREVDRPRNSDRLNRRRPTRGIEPSAPSSEETGSSPPAVYTPPPAPQTDVRPRNPDRLNRRGPSRRFESAEPSSGPGASSAPAYTPPPQRRAPPPSSQPPDSQPAAQSPPPDRPQRGENRRRPLVEPDEEIQ